MELLPNDLATRMPALYATEQEPDPTAHVRFFTPDSNWTWYGFEYDPADKIFFGLVDGFEKEWGYFSLDELTEAHGPLGLPIERDLYFKPTPRSILLGGSGIHLVV